MGNFIKKIKANISLAINSLFYGMKGADNTMLAQTSGEEGTEAHKQIVSDSVMGDFLNQQETQRVKEMRDSYYRILKEADKYDASKSFKMSFDEEGNLTQENFELTNNLSKKTKEDFMQHSPCFENGLKIRTIQDNKKLMKHTMFELELPKGELDYDTTLDIERDGFTPRLPIEKFVTKMVVRIPNEENRAIVDLYLPTEAGQFTKIDAIFIANINRLWKGIDDPRCSDLLDFKTIKWYSDRGWNTEEGCIFEYDDVKFDSINIFDGSFVVSFNCNIVNNGKDLAEKFKTKELDEKYATEAPKTKEIDMFTLQRHNERVKQKEIDLSNLDNNILKIEN